MGDSKGEKASWISKFFTVFGTVLCVILAPVLILNCTLIVKSYLNKEAVPDIGGYATMIVLSDSMYPEMKSGDLILCRQADPQTVNVGDIITFFDPDSVERSVITHRVAEIHHETDGSLSWITRGDANNADDTSPVPAANLVGVYQFRIPRLGDAAIFMQTTKGLIVCVLIPVLCMAGFDFVRRGIYDRQRKKDTEVLLAELELLRAERTGSAIMRSEKTENRCGDSTE